MPKFDQCYRCKLLLPIYLLTTIVARGNSSGRIMRVKVCNACRSAIIKEQQRGQ